MIMHTFADWGNTGQNMAEYLGITTVSEKVAGNIAESSLAKSSIGKKYIWIV